YESPRAYGGERVSMLCVYRSGDDIPRMGRRNLVAFVPRSLLVRNFTFRVQLELISVGGCLRWIATVPPVLNWRARTSVPGRIFDRDRCKPPAKRQLCCDVVLACGTGQASRSGARSLLNH